MKKIKIFMISALFLAFSSQIFGADATVTFVKGKVEVKRGDNWIPLEVGDVLSKSDIINTGFQSEAKIKFLDSIMYLAPVTRITIENLSSGESVDKVSTYLATGAVRSKVNHTSSKRVNYTVKTAIATASVRGTDWIINDSNQVTCLEGAVAVMPSLNVPVTDFSSYEEDIPSDEDFSESEELSDVVGDSGVLVGASQTTTVNNVVSISLPQNTSIQSAVNITNTLTSASTKNAVNSISGSSSDFVESSNTETSEVVIDFPAVEPIVEPQPQVETATATIEFSFED